MRYQKQQDKLRDLIIRWTLEIPHPTKRLLEIGAFGKTGSLTHTLITQHHYEAHLIEPDPRNFCTLLDLYQTTPNVHLYNLALAPTAQLFRFWLGESDRMLSSLSTEHIRLFREDGHTFLRQPICIHAVTPKQLLTATGTHFDLTIIDCEGISPTIAKHLTRNPDFNSQILVVEHQNEPFSLPGYTDTDSTSIDRIYLRDPARLPEP